MLEGEGKWAEAETLHRQALVSWRKGEAKGGSETAYTLHKLGVKRVRPLRGGFDEWKRLGYPMDAIEPVIPETRPLVQWGN